MDSKYVMQGIRWRHIRQHIWSPRVQVTLMSLSMLVAALAGSAAKRWA